jgi:hypothetical protein
VTNGDVKASNLLKLPLDSTSNIVNLLSERFVMGNWSWEETNSVKMVTADLGDLGNDSVGSEEDLILLGPLGDSLLLLVELGKSIKSGDINFNTLSSNLIGVLLIGNDADSQFRSWDVRKSDSSCETLILLRIVILKTNLEFSGLLELSFLGLLSHLGDVFQDFGVCNFRG